ncbi:type II toxin-antitoxin system RelE/ParE family toxin [Enterovibrio baiacu]|uniref:type II toxin-antitoxin system RelE/ParE family toxin n=1 Tax=Enterovibrio baiacu TaxID=2491023 RepID=UPI003D0A81D0
MYKLSNKAADDFGGIYEYTYLNFGEEQADIYVEEMEACLLTLSGEPLMGRDCGEIGPGIRRHDFQKHALFYRVRESDIFVLRILHQQMNPLRHFP